MQLCSNLATSPNPKADVFQIFQNNRLLCALRFRDKLLADLVVEVFGEAGFLARTLFKQTTRRDGAFALQFLSQSAMAFTKVADMCAAEGLPFTIRGNAGDAQINPKKSVRLIRQRFNDIDRGKKKPFAPARHKVGFALARFKQFAFACAADEGNPLPTSDRPDCHIVRPVAQNAIIVGNRAIPTKGRLSLPVESVGIGNLADESDNDLGRS
jgi:hypothetical protein